MCPNWCSLQSLFRIAIGVTLALIGVDHYMNMPEFSTMVSGSLGPITMLGTLWAYILPALQIIGGLWFAFDGSSKYASTVVGVVFLSISVGMLLKPLLGDATIGDVIGNAQNALTWMMFAVISISVANYHTNKK